MSENENGAQKVQMQLDGLSGPINGFMQVALRGFLASYPQVNHGIIFSVVAEQLGYLLAASMVADIPTHVQLRKAFAEAFAQGVKKAPMQQMGLQLAEGGPSSPILKAN